MLQNLIFYEIKSIFQAALSAVDILMTNLPLSTIKDSKQFW